MPTKRLPSLDRYTLGILALLAANPTRSYYQREIARKAKVSVGKTNQVLNRLRELDMVTREPRGKIHLYRYNLDDPAARHLKIFLNLTELSGLSRALRKVSNKVVLFGSVADGSDTEESDIDLLIVTADKRGTEEALAQGGKEAGRNIAPVVLSQLEFSGLKKEDPAFYEQAARGIVLWQKGE